MSTLTSTYETDRYSYVAIDFNKNEIARENITWIELIKHSSNLIVSGYVLLVTNATYDIQVKVADIPPSWTLNPEYAS